MSRSDKDSRFQELYQRHYRAIVRFFRRLGFSQESARDLAQETFMRVFKSMDTYRGDGEWSFLKTTARHLALNVIRGAQTLKRNAPEVSLDALPFPPSFLANNPWTGAPSPSQENDLIEDEERKLRQRRLIAAIRSLPELTRLCVLLRLRGCKYKEVQKILDLSMDQVKSRLYDARNRLREQLGEGVDLPGGFPEDDDD